MDFAQQPSVNLAPNTGVGSQHSRLFTGLMQLMIVVFTVSLGWFSFIYYPKIVDQFKGVGLPQKKVIANAANLGSFPIETESFRLVYETSSNTYYAFINGKNIAEFADNKNSATLALKTALSVDSICNLNVIFASNAKLDVPQDLKNPASCR